MRCIVDQRDIKLPGNLHQFVHIAGQPGIMYTYNGFRTFVNQLFYMVNTDVHGFRINIGKLYLCTHV